MMQLSSHKGYSLRQISWAQREGGTFFKMAILLRFWAFHAQKKNQNSSYLEDGDESSAQQARGQFDE